VSTPIYRVLFDDQIFRKQSIGGISNYFLSLIQHLQNLPNLKVQSAALLYKTTKLSDFNTGRKIRYRKRSIAPIAIVLNSLKTLFSNYDLIHSTYYSRWSVSLISRKPHIVTIHDMIPEDYPELFLSGNPNRYKERYIKSADGIIVISSYTYDRLIHFYPEISCPIALIPLASSYVLDDASKVDSRRKFDTRLILFVGPRGGHKNFLVLAYSLSQVIKNFPDISLLCIGGGEFRDSETQLFDELGISPNVKQRECNDEELRDLYMKCSLVVCPSIAEGFGLPSVEAASLFTPVIVGQNSYLGKKLPPALVLSDINDYLDLARKIICILESYEYFLAVAKFSYSSVEDISWRYTSDKTRNFYKQILAKLE
jgi:glycosyltransferase involved in cell wall biosynthesis